MHGNQLLAAGSQAPALGRWQTPMCQLRTEATLRRRCQRRQQGTAAYTAEEEKEASQPTVQPVSFVVEVLIGCVLHALVIN